MRDLSCGDRRVLLDIEVRRVECVRCGKVIQEKLPFLANNPFYTKRFAFYVGRRCRSATIKDVAKELHLDWHTVKELEKQYMREQLRRVGKPAPKVIGIDEISIKKRHVYRILVSDLVRERPISITAMRIPALFLAPSHLKNSSMLASERSCPPNQPSLSPWVEVVDAQMPAADAH